MLLKGGVSLVASKERLIERLWPIVAGGSASASGAWAEGRTAVIAGPSGIGQAAAALLTEDRANHRTRVASAKKKLETLALDLVSLPGRTTLMISTDVNGPFMVEALVRGRRMVRPRGHRSTTPCWQAFRAYRRRNPDNQRRLFSQLLGAINCIQLLSGLMQSQGRGHIVNVASVAAKISPPCMECIPPRSLPSRRLRRSALGAGGSVSASASIQVSARRRFMENMTQRSKCPPSLGIARFVGSDAVARRIVESIRLGLRDAYVSWRTSRSST